MDSSGIIFILNFVLIGQFFSKVGKEMQTLMHNMMISKAYILSRKKGKNIEAVFLVYLVERYDDIEQNVIQEGCKIMVQIVILIVRICSTFLWQN
jgi:hypothetical protein